MGGSQEVNLTWNEIISSHVTKGTSMVGVAMARRYGFKSSSSMNCAGMIGVSSC